MNDPNIAIELAEAENLFRNYYVCICGHEWEEIWSATCDSECPECGATIEVHHSIIYISLIQNIERLLAWLGNRDQSSTGKGESLAVTNARAALNKALKNPPTTPKVEITMHSGLVSDVRSDVPVDIRVVDYDNDGADPERVEQDIDGADCVVSEYPASVEPFMINRREGH